MEKRAPNTDPFLGGMSEGMTGLPQPADREKRPRGRNLRAANRRFEMMVHDGHDSSLYPDLLAGPSRGRGT